MLLLYQHDVAGRPLDEIVAQHERDTGQELPAYSRGLIDDVLSRQVDLDAEIDRRAEGWSADRIAPVERAVLRVGLVELDRDDPPGAVALAEAVGLARRYASPEAATFVNGVLGSAARERGRGR